jgi:hypothetical protein
MSTYQDEIFNYFTKKDNFYSAYEIHKLFPEVKNKIIEQFWLAVKDSLEALNKDSGWKIDISENIFETYSSLYIEFDENFYVLFEKLHGQTYYGLWINHENKKLDRQQINQFAEKIPALNNMMKKSHYFLGMNETGANFDDIETLKKILPDNKDDYVHELAKLLFDLAIEVQNDILVMSKMKVL